MAWKKPGNKPKIILLLAASFVAYMGMVAGNSGSKKLSSSQSPEGYTGANGVYCTSCHSTNALNTAGGAVAATGLPSGSYIAGRAYAFSMAISHAQADRKKWGFSIVAVNKAGQPVGTFSTTNPNAALSGAELSHADAVTTAEQASYTYTNLTWTAPANPTADDEVVTFYYAANAANGNFSTSGDFIYATQTAASLQVVYTFTGNGLWSQAANWANNTLPPATLTGTGEIIINPTAGGACTLDIPQTMGSGTKLTLAPNARLIVQGNLLIQQ